MCETPGKLYLIQNSLLLSMPVRYSHDQKAHSLYFITFTCYRWLHLFEIAGAYGAVYKWFDYFSQFADIFAVLHPLYGIPLESHRVPLRAAVELFRFLRHDTLSIY